MSNAAQAFDRISGVLQPVLTRCGFAQVDARHEERAFGSRVVAWSDVGRLVRLVWDGKESWFVVEGAPQPRPGGEPGWVNLALHRFDPRKGDEPEVIGIAEAMRRAVERFLA